MNETNGHNVSLINIDLNRVLDSNMRLFILSLSRPADDTSHESAEPSRSDATNSCRRPLVTHPLVYLLLLCLSALRSL